MRWSLRSRTTRAVWKVLFIATVLYLSLGSLYRLVGLYCYNVRNWDLQGRFSFPPLFFPFGCLYDHLFWPVYVWANLINGFGVFGRCGPG